MIEKYKLILFTELGIIVGGIVSGFFDFSRAVISSSFLTLCLAVFLWIEVYQSEKKKESKEVSK